MWERWECNDENLPNFEYGNSLQQQFSSEGLTKEKLWDENLLQACVCMSNPFRHKFELPLRNKV